VVILGPNGAGKSTFVRAIAGLVPIHAGTTGLRGADVTHVPAHEKVRDGLAFVPQTENVFATLSIADNLRLAADILPRAERSGRIARIYQMFPDLADRSSRRAGALSGGQRQMLAIARALIVEPSVLILDEPSAGLSPKIVGEVFATLRAVRASGVAIVLVEQNVKAALAVADRALILVEGRLRHEGTAAGLAEDPLVAQLYLGVRREQVMAPA
jgi:branched-chain amino acid transport system ATP-binding protein